MEYGDSHRVLLTYIRSVKYISHGDLVKCFLKILHDLSIQVDSIDQCFTDHIDLINSKIGGHGFKVERSIDETNNELHYLFVHTNINDEVSKTFSNYTINELDTIKKLIENIVEAANFEYSIGKVNAKQIVVVSQNRTSSEALAFISSLVDNGWLVITGQDRVLLSQRAIAELKTYLTDRYGAYEADGKIILCAECKNIVTIGSFVPESRLGFHYNCLDLHQKNNNSTHETRQIGPDLSTI